MKWKYDALVRNVIAKLPTSLSYRVHYFLQRKFGGLRNPAPIRRLLAGKTIVDYICNQNKSAESKTFLEVGTGISINVPIALWLCGASKIITVDLNPYMKAELIQNDITYMKNHQLEVEALFQDFAAVEFFKDRFEKLLKVDQSIENMSTMMGIKYIAPCKVAPVPVYRSRGIYSNGFA